MYVYISILPENQNGHYEIIDIGPDADDDGDDFGLERPDYSVIRAHQT